jgi:hypothetical protein
MEHAEDSKQFCAKVPFWRLVTVAGGTQLNTPLSWYADSSLHGRILLIVCHIDAGRDGRDAKTLGSLVLLLKPSPYTVLL